MKLLIISPKFHPVIGGGETFVLNSARRLHDHGVQVSVAVEPNADRNLNDFPFKVYEVEGLSDSQLDVINGTANLYKLITELQPDLIHVHGYFGLLAAGLCNKMKIPIIVSIHSTPVWHERIIGGMDSFDAELSFARKVLALANPSLVTAANNVYAQAAEKIVRGGFKVEVVPYPVDRSFFKRKTNAALRNKLGLKPSDVLVAVPSRVIERKGIREAVYALANLPENFYLYIPGAYDPLDKAYWQDICASEEYQQVASRIFVPNHKLLYEEMPELYAACDIIAMPSYYEGAPVATVEAMASGKPFVGADSQGINGFIKHEQNGLLVPQKDPVALAKAIERLSKDKVWGDKLASQAQHDIAWLDWENQLPQLLAAYDSVLAPVATKEFVTATA